MIWPTLWLVLAVAIGIGASNRGRSGFAWFLLSALLSPLAGLVLLIASKDLSATKTIAASMPAPATHVKCPACAEFVLPDAKVCKHCGRELAPDPQFAARQVAAKQHAEREESKNVLIGVGVIAGLIAAFYIAAHL
jgi:phosphotransferase system  glucose/maltose/N-acetylglucosamine-specific IIC component